MIAKLLSWLLSTGLNRLAEFFQDGMTGRFSAKRLVLVLGGMSLSYCAIVLVHKVGPGVEVSSELWAVTTPLAAMGGAGYILGKYVERKGQVPKPGTPDQAAGGGE